MKLESQSFKEGQAIPVRYAFGKIDPHTHVTLSDNINPHFAWEGAPAETASYVLICHDYDVPTRPDDVNQEGREVPADLPRTDFFHWVLLDIPHSQHEIAEGAYCNGISVRGKSGPSGPQGQRHGINDYTGWFAGDDDMKGTYFGYDGPCPPWNDSIVHHYVFTLYALDVDRLEVSGDLTGANVREAMQGHILAEANLTGLFSLNPRIADTLS
ncbi:YbhB/YbcL family Raf kinase inhibitor-like protein [Pokkaliibacter sp. CJK22405]|uniref:YbhB/YbcL family Raf kinase inhibitor-like protein n=1 Tax=Pokkaliibacter sp. CJK22405 TaxID=3384615 RepID=UPI003984F08F